LRLVFPSPGGPMRILCSIAARSARVHAGFILIERAIIRGLSSGKFLFETKAFAMLDLMASGAEWRGHTLQRVSSGKI